MFRGFLGKMECKTQCLFCNLNNFLATKIVTHQTGEWLIDDLRSPNTFDARLGERASANVTPCILQNLLNGYTLEI